MNMNINTNMSKRAKIITIISATAITVFVGVLGILSVSYINKRSHISTKTDPVVQQIIQGKITEAYKATSGDFRKNRTKEEFTNSTGWLKDAKLESSQEINADKVRGVVYLLSATNGQTASITFTGSSSRIDTVLVQDYTKPKK